MYNNCCYSELEKSIRYICYWEYDYFLKKKNVVAVGLGCKFTNGFYTDEKCIKVFVTHKVNKTSLCLSDVVPSIYKNIKTDVVESGPIKFSGLKARIRPVIGGYSIGNVISEETGSVACLVTDGKKNYFLSNNHVLAGINVVPLGDPIIQPGVADGGILPKAFVGTLSKYITLRHATLTSSNINYVDCAIAEVSTPKVASPKIAFIGNITGVSTVKLFDVVQKASRTTEYTIGKIQSICVTTELKYNSQKFIFKDQILSNKITDKGDSGCLLVNTNKEAVGLYFSICDTYSVYNPIYKVLSSLNVNILSK